MLAKAFAAKEDYRLKKMADLVRPFHRVLDLGCAEMPNPYLTNQQVVGMDLVAGDCPANYTEMRVGDVMELPRPFEPGSFDVIIAGELIEHLERPLDFLRCCRETLRPGGRMVLSTPNPNSPFERMLTLSLNRRLFYAEDHITLFPQRWLVRMLERTGFSDVRLMSGGIQFPFVGLVPFPRPWCYQTIAIAGKPSTP